MHGALRVGDKLVLIEGVVLEAGAVVEVRKVCMNDIIELDGGVVHVNGASVSVVLKIDIEEIEKTIK